METFKDYASSVVDSIVEYIRDKSCFKNLDLIVEDVKFDVRDDLYNGNYSVTKYRCKISNKLLDTDNTILVNVGLYDNDYTLDIYSNYLHNFGISAIISDLNISPLSDYSVSLDVCYLEKLDTSSGTCVVKDSFPGALLVKDSSYTPTFSLDGTLLLSEKLSHDLVLDIVKKFLHKSHLVFNDN